MKERRFILNVAAQDAASRVRGIGTYTTGLADAITGELIDPKHLLQVGKNDVFIHPFFDVTKPPLYAIPRCRKTIAIVHDVIPLAYPQHYPLGIRGRINVFINLFLSKKYTTILTVSQWSKKNIAKKLALKEDGIKVVYPFVKQHFFTTRPIRPLSAPPEYVVYVGDATWNKNIVNIAKAVSEAKIPCLFIGKVFEEVKNYKQGKHSSFLETLTNPWQEELKRFSEEAIKNPYVTCVGYVTDEELVGYYAHALANMLVSYDEGFGYSVLEAGAVGTPSIVSECEVFAETAQGGTLVAKAEDPQAIARQIHAIKEQGLRAKLSEQIQKRSKFFSKERFREHFLSLAT